MIQDLLAEAEQRMSQAVDHVVSEFATVRTGRANPQILKRVTVDYYGTPTPVLQLASVNVPEPRLMVVSPFVPNALSDIEKAISSSDLGRTWSPPRSLAAAAPGGFGDFSPGTANSAVQLRHGPLRGRLLVALSAKNAIGVIVSDDHGRTWKPGALAAVHFAGEPTVMELADGRVVVSPRVRIPRARPSIRSDSRAAATTGSQSSTRSGSAPDASQNRRR